MVRRYLCFLLVFFSLFPFLDRSDYTFRLLRSIYISFSVFPIAASNVRLCSPMLEGVTAPGTFDAPREGHDREARSKVVDVLWKPKPFTG